MVIKRLPTWSASFASFDVSSTFSKRAGVGGGVKPTPTSPSVSSVPVFARASDEFFQDVFFIGMYVFKFIFKDHFLTPFKIEVQRVF